MNFRKVQRNETIRAAFFLLLVLNICFYPFIWGKKTLLESARDAPSIVSQGAAVGPRQLESFYKVLDPGAAAWQSEPWLQLIRNEYLHNKTLPLWNPYQAYGTPLAANMLSQPFSPFTLAVLPALTAKTYNFYILLRLFAAGFFTYLFLRYFVAFLPALGGAVSCMLTGYFILYLTISHLSVEVLLPACFWAAEMLLRRQNFRSLATFSVIVAANIVGGMPESSLLCLGFTAAFFLFRFVNDAELYRRWRSVGALIVGGFSLSLGLSAFLVVPFYEFLHNSWNAHEGAHLGSFIVGLIHDPLDPSVATYVFPLLFGPVHSHVFASDNDAAGYFGITALFFSIISVIAIFGPYRRTDRRLTSLTCFFALFAVAILCKRYGVFPLQQVGLLPLFTLVKFTKYEEPLLGFCIASLCGIGLDRLLNKQISLKSVSMTLAFLAALIAFTAFGCLSIIQREIQTKGIPALFPELALGVPMAAVLIAATVLLLQRNRWYPGGRKTITAGIFVGVLTAESIANYIFPNYFVFSRAPLTQTSPYKGAPFVTELQRHTADQWRVFGRDQLLVPSWASAFGLLDIRDLGAMYYKKYFPFLQNFFVSYQTMAPDLESCFRGFGPYEFVDPLQLRLLQLSSVRFICSLRPFSRPNPLLDELLKQNDGHLAAGRQNQIAKEDVTIDHVSRPALWEHPPYDRLPLKLTVGKSLDEVFRFSYGLDPAVFDKTTGDGVEFILDAKDGRGHISRLFSNYIDPKHNPQERHWIDGSADLAAYRGQPIELLFSTSPGPKKDNSYDWAIWSNFHFAEDTASQQHPFVSIFDGDAKIYEYGNVLPRAALFYKADVEKGEAKVLQQLRNLKFDVFGSAVVNSADLTNDQVVELQKLNGGAQKPVEAARILSYTPEAVTISAEPYRKALLVLNDSDYPGWQVNVDGKSEKWFAANYMFRAVVLEPGRHTVKFFYKPASFAAGLSISLLTAVSMLIMGASLASRQRQQSKQAAVNN